LKWEGDQGFIWRWEQPFEKSSGIYTKERSPLVHGEESTFAGPKKRKSDGKKCLDENRAKRDREIDQKQKPPRREVGEVRLSAVPKEDYVRKQPYGASKENQLYSVKETSTLKRDLRSVLLSVTDEQGYRLR